MPAEYLSLTWDVTFLIVLIPPLPWSPPASVGRGRLAGGWWLVAVLAFSCQKGSKKTFSPTRARRVTTQSQPSPHTTHSNPGNQTLDTLCNCAPKVKSCVMTRGCRCPPDEIRRLDAGSQVGVRSELVGSGISKHWDPVHANRRVYVDIICAGNMPPLTSPAQPSPAAVLTCYIHYAKHIPP